MVEKHGRNQRGVLILARTINNLIDTRPQVNNLGLTTYPTLGRTGQRPVKHRLKPVQAQPEGCATALLQSIQRQTNRSGDLFYSGHRSGDLCHICAKNALCHLAALAAKPGRLIKNRPQVKNLPYIRTGLAAPEFVGEDYRLREVLH